jgi:hypothetical protein
MNLAMTPTIFSACCLPVLGQQAVQAPIYKVTVEQRSIEAVNYGQRDEPAKIDFRGTVLLPRAEGSAKVESRPGAVDIDAKFKGLKAPAQFGPRYLTYVLWAITPEGRPVNLGEVLPGPSNKARLKVTTRLQAFGLLVTAEPCFSVTQPSNVVVLENVVRPDTQGRLEEVKAKFELLRRDQHPVAESAVDRQYVRNEEKPVPMDRHEALLALYEAQNALQIARSQGAGRYVKTRCRKRSGCTARRKDCRTTRTPTAASSPSRAKLRRPPGTRARSPSGASQAAEAARAARQCLPPSTAILSLNSSVEISPAA